MKKLTLPTSWAFNKYRIGFEGGAVPSRAASGLWFFWPCVMIGFYPRSYLYSVVLSFHLFKWYIGIKWCRNPDDE